MCVCVCVCTCVNACMLLQASLGNERFLTDSALKSLEGVVQRPVHLQTVLGGKALPANLAGVWPHPRVVQHVNAQGVQLGKSLATDVTHKLPFGAVLHLIFWPLRIFCGCGSRHAGSLGLLMLVTGQMRSERSCVLEFLIANLWGQTKGQKNNQNA